MVLLHRVAIAGFCMSTLAGCALTPDAVPLNYVSETSVSAVPEATAVDLAVDVHDRRDVPPLRFSRKKNGYGMEMAEITATEPIADVVRVGLQSELRALGFKIIDQSRLRVDVDVVRFWNDFKLGFFSGDAVGEVTLSIRVQSDKDSRLYTKTVTASSDIGGVQVMSGDNAKSAAEKALAAVMVKLLSDPAFVRSLLKSNAIS